MPLFVDVAANVATVRVPDQDPSHPADGIVPERQGEVEQPLRLVG